MKMENIQFRLDKKLLKQLKSYPWAKKNKSEAIRTIVTGFCDLSEDEQQVYLNRRLGKERSN